jgi:DNA-binding transcriptional regulator YhcF (GntR family)
VAAPYEQIADEIRRRIEAGELRPGDRVPSTRGVAKEWGVALATAAKALRALSVSGLVEAVPRVGTIVANGQPPQRRDTELSREQVVAAAIAIADEGGLLALSMRGVAARLGVAAMTPYRQVASKGELVLLMIDTALGEESFPEVPPDGWRARLEMAARVQWVSYRRHPWLAQAISLTRPQLLHNTLVHAEWMLGALDGLALSMETMFHVYLTVFNHVRGTAVNLQWENDAEEETGMTDQEWLDEQDKRFAEFAAAGPFPVFTKVSQSGFDYQLSLDALFEFGLQRVLDGLAVFIAQPG